MLSLHIIVYQLIYSHKINLTVRSSFPTRLNVRKMCEVTLSACLLFKTQFCLFIDCQNNKPFQQLQNTLNSLFAVLKAIFSSQGYSFYSFMEVLGVGVLGLEVSCLGFSVDGVWSLRCGALANMSSLIMQIQ